MAWARDEEVKGLIIVGDGKYKFQTDVRKSISPTGKAVTIRRTADFPNLREARAWARGLKNRCEDGSILGPEPTDGPEGWTVRQAMDRYMASGKLRPTTQKAVRYHLPYLAPILDTPLGSLRKSDCREAHAAIKSKSAANGAFRYLSAAWEYAEKFDDHDRLPGKPTRGVMWHKSKARKAKFFELKDWSERLKTVSVPRRHYHALALLGGFRGSMLSMLRWEDVLEDRILFPAEYMKSDREFAAPMSTQMQEVVSTIPRLSNRFVFPAQSASGHLTEWKEPALKPFYGHQLRKRYATVAENLDIPSNKIAALLDHAQPGLEKNYRNRAAMFTSLAEAQQMVSDRLVADGLSLPDLEK